VVEQTYVCKRNGTLHRPFATVAEVRCRGYSLPLQRVITDFGADNAFGQVGAKLKEHYGISVPLNAAVTLTERHAHALSEADITPSTATTVTPLALIVEADGSMIPVVQIGEGTPDVPDKRKHRTLQWKEARLSLVRRPDEVEPTFDVTLGDVATTGAALKRLAEAAGLKPRTRVHGVGDGAPWIAEQVDIQFGAQGHYLIDFYHLCDYLAAAAPVCAPDQPSDWMTCQKDRLKTGQLNAVMAALNPHVEPDTVASDHAPVRACYRYIVNRPGQFKYQEALAANLPIGSGEVESAHRFVIQKRLKLPGAWWSPNNAQAMLNLRVLRANHCWQRYWNNAAA
jgi:hypothetical protein